ncbi:MAG: DUF1731 domain-containing protein [Cryobacterium sp.]
MKTEKPRAVIAGASGFIGQRMLRELRAQGYSVSRIGRAGPDARWSDEAGVRALIDGADLVLNLAGKSVNCRYTDLNRDELVRSRVETTRQIRHAIASSTRPPRLWLNASGVTIYRDALDQAMTERSGEPGAGFSADLAKHWEDEFFSGDLPGTRRVALRLAIVLGDGPATRVLLRLARLGIGGTQYDGRWFSHRRYRSIGAPARGANSAPARWSRGRQKFSWIHIDDVVGSIRFIDDTADLTGPVILSAPQASDNRELMATLRRRVGARLGLPAYRWMLEPALWALRTEPDLVLRSRWVVPERLLAAGYRFRWTDLDAAVQNIVRPQA